MEEITTFDLARELRVSERTVRRFEYNDDPASSAQFVFAYADLVNMELRIDTGSEESQSIFGGILM